MSEVCDRAARLARTLADRGVGAETLVGICVERGVGMLTAMLAVWWAGGAYVPLDPSFPEARLTAMAQGASLRIHHLRLREVRSRPVGSRACRGDPPRRPSDGGRAAARSGAGT